MVPPVLLGALRGQSDHSHHVDALERAGVVSRVRDPDDRRMVRVELTDAGDELFHRLRKAATAFDRRLRAGLSEGDVERLRGLIGRLEANVAGSDAD